MTQQPDHSPYKSYDEAAFCGLYGESEWLYGIDGLTAKGGGNDGLDVYSHGDYLGNYSWDYVFTPEGRSKIEAKLV